MEWVGLKIILAKGVKKWFDKEPSLETNHLKNAAKELLEGKFDANLGGNLYKKRVATCSSKGKSSGSRVIVAYKKKNNIFFMYAFNKNERANINDKEKAALKARAKIYFNWTDKELEKALSANVFYQLDEV